MLNHDTQPLSGPDFLDEVANAEENDGRLINAATYRQRAREWRDMQRQYEAAANAMAELDAARRRIAELEDVIAATSATLQRAA